MSERAMVSRAHCCGWVYHYELLTVAMLIQPGRNSRESTRPPVIAKTVDVMYALIELIVNKRTIVAWGV